MRLGNKFWATGVLKVDICYLKCHLVEIPFRTPVHITPKREVIKENHGLKMYQVGNPERCTVNPGFFAQSNFSAAHFD